MKLEEAITHCIEVAEENERDIGYYTIQGDKEWLDECEKDCIECAKEHRQLAEWLKELKAYREARQELEDRHAVGTLDLIDSYIEEVKADDT